MKIKALTDRFGSNRMNAERPGELLRGCSFIAVPFAGGMCEVPHMAANIVVVNDLDRAVINLAEVVRDRREKLAEWLDATAFHPDALAKAQASCVEKGASVISPDFEWAAHYFVSSWMVRGGNGGTDGEFDAPLSIRWKSGGGDSVVRFRNATESLAAWQEVMRRCTFTTLDCFDFLGQCAKRDIPENGIYCDPPWPDDGNAYHHKFTDDMQRHLADVLAGFQRTRVVARFGDHPLIRELYPESKWTWHKVTGRTQANADKAEVLLVLHG